MWGRKDFCPSTWSDTDSNQRSAVSWEFLSLSLSSDVCLPYTMRVYSTSTCVYLEKWKHNTRNKEKSIVMWPFPSLLILIEVAPAVGFWYFMKTFRRGRGGGVKAECRKTLHLSNFLYMYLWLFFYAHYKKVKIWTKLTKKGECAKICVPTSPYSYTLASLNSDSVKQ